jgi:protein arginine N-methyltransferase 1
VYELADYLAMIADHRRTSAYLAAMSQVIRPGDRVLELGTGFGFFAIHAARLGAEHVWAVEPHDAVGLGPEIARLNGVADRITFIQDITSRVELPARAQVLVEDMRGTSPLLQGRVAALVDARERLLEPGARVIPRRDRLMAAPTAMPSGRESDAGSSERHGIDVSAASERARLGVQRVPATSIVPLAAPACWFELDYERITSPDADGTVRFLFERPARVAGIATWFDAELAPGIGFSSGPADERSVYDCGWLPLERVLDVGAGESLEMRLRTKHDGTDYVWAWDTTLLGRAGDVREPRLRQSNLPSLLLSAERRARRAASHAPPPPRDADALVRAVSMIDGRRTLGEIAQALVRREPSRFPDEQSALRWVGDMLARVEERA